MKVAAKLPLALIISALSLSCYGETNCKNPTGKWVSTSGAQLEIFDLLNDETAKIEFKSPADLKYENRFTSGTAVFGNTNINNVFPDKPSVVSFTVHFKHNQSEGDDSMSISSWSGYCQKKGDKETITSIWTGVRPNEDRFIDHINTHPTIFTPVEE